MIDLVLFPSSYFSGKIVEPDMKKEHDAAVSTGLFDTVLFDNAKWFDEKKLVLNKEFPTKQNAIMRGWMMKPECYELFYSELLKRNIRLVTTPAEYAKMHIFPNIYSVFGEDTSKMLIFPLHEEIPLERVKKEFDRFMIKDFVKSVKGTKFPRYFDASVTQDEFNEWMKVFYELRGNLLTGGICVKQFLDLKFYGDRPNEYRVFYANNEIATICRNSGQPNYSPEPPKSMLEKYRNLSSPYYTVDYAELADGTWKVLEAGDGSVSGLSDNQDAGEYFRILSFAFNNKI